MSNKSSWFLRVFVTLIAVLCFGGATGWAAGPWFVSNSGNDSNSCLGPGAGSACLTINGAIAKASAGDTINVAAGTYNEQVIIPKTLTLLGAQAGVDARTRSASESIITHTCGPVQIQADNVTLNGFTMQGANDASGGCFFAGIWTNPGFSGTQGGHQILNNIIQNNISGIELDSSCTNPTLVQFNLIQNNNNPGPGAGNGIQTNFSLCNATIDSNKFSGHSNASVLSSAGVGTGSSLTVSNNLLAGGANESIAWLGVTNSSITGNTSVGTLATGTIDLFGGDSNITVSSNVLRNGVRGIWVENPYAIYGVGPNTNISAHLNCIVGNTTAGLEASAGGYTGTLDADNNWWGSANGPTIASNPGGNGDAIIDPDAVVDYTPFLTAPAPACAATAADMTITKSHLTAFRQGDASDTYTITVTNQGPGATSGADPITVTDTLPAGLTPTGPIGTVNGWNCSILSQTFTCTRNDVLGPFLNYPAITLTVSVASNAPTPVTNTATVSGGGETVTSNDSASDPTTITQVADLTIAKSHLTSFKQGDAADTYTVTVTNSGTGPTSGTVTVSDTLPAGLTPTGPTGAVNGWSCSIASQTVTCTRSDVLGASSYPAIPITVSVANNAAPNVTNTATVSGGGEVVTNNDSASDPTAITQVADLTITKSHLSTFKQGDTVDTYTVTVSNSGSGPTSGTVTVSDTLPTGLTPTAPNGSVNGWACTIVSQTVTCTRSDVLATTLNYPAIMIDVSVANNAPANVTNTATVSGGGEVVTNNDSASDPTNITQVADMTITKTHPANFQQGDTGDTYLVTVRNSGTGPTVGTVTVTDTLPAGLTPTGPNGAFNGWSCSIASQTVTCTRSDVLAPSTNYPVITITVNVAANAPPVVTNTATVSGGGEVVTNNDSASDPTATTPVADLSISKVVVGGPQFAAGANLTYTITVINNGLSAATGVTVTDILTGTTFVSATPSQGSCSGTTTVTCSLGGLANGGSASVTLVVTTSVTPGVVSNTATVTGSQVDTNANNNSANSTITTVPPSTIPAVTGWALIALAGMIALLGAMKMRS